MREFDQLFAQKCLELGNNIEVFIHNKFSKID